MGHPDILKPTCDTCYCDNGAIALFRSGRAAGLADFDTHQTAFIQIIEIAVIGNGDIAGVAQRRVGKKRDRRGLTVIVFIQFTAADEIIAFIGTDRAFF